MPYQNLTSTLDAAATAPIMTSLNTLQTTLAPHSINLTADEIAGMYKMSINRQSLGSRSIQIAEANPTLIPAFLNLGAARQDNDRYVNLLALEMKLKAILQGIEHARIASGSETLLFARGFYASLQAAAVQNVAGAGALLAELQQYFDLPPQPDGGDTDVVNPDQP
jgi:hypothetical protein